MDTGLLQGLAEGLKSGIQSYREEQDRQYKRDLEQKKFQKEQQEQEERLGLLRDQRETEKMRLGLKRDTEGNWVQDPESLVFRKEAREAESAKQEGLLKSAQIKKYEAEAAKTAKEARGLMGSDEQSFKTLPKDRQITIEKLSGTKANMSVAKSQIEELRKQIQDKTIPEKDRLATANEQLKLLNSTLGADAVGAEEVSRLASFLQYKPDPFGPKGMKLGPDLDSFAKQLERVEKRVSGTEQTLQKQIDTSYGRKSKSGLLTEQQPMQQENTKVWNGVTYKRIGNEWVPQ